MAKTILCAWSSLPSQANVTSTRSPRSNRFWNPDAILSWKLFQQSANSSAIAPFDFYRFFWLFFFFWLQFIFYNYFTRKLASYRLDSIQYHHVLCTLYNSIIFHILSLWKMWIWLSKTPQENDKNSLIFIDGNWHLTLAFKIGAEKLFVTIFKIKQFFFGAMLGVGWQHIWTIHQLFARIWIEIGFYTS